MRICSTLMEFITLKMIEYRRLIVQLTDTKGGIRQKRKFPQKVMVWLGVCSKGVFIPPLVIFKDGTMDHDRYIKEVLPFPLKFGNDMFGTDWTFQQDRVQSHTFMQNHRNGCVKSFPCFIHKDH